MRKKRNIITLSLILILLVNLLLGCNQSPGNVEDNNQVNGENTEQAVDNDKKDDGSTLSLPIVEEPVTLTVWWPQYAEMTKVVDNLAENEFFQELEKRTNVKIEFIHPPIGQEGEYFNLMIASGEYPDLIYRATQYYPGGGGKAISDGVYLRLNDLIDEYAPNYKALRESNTEYRKMTSDDNGDISCFMEIYSEEEGPWIGPMVREDWLNDLGLDIPVTYDDWYNMLTAFKEEKGAEAPLLLMAAGFPYMTSSLTAGYGFGVGSLQDGLMYQVDGEVKFGALEPGFLEYLTMMNKWYSEGLIDPDFFMTTGWQADITKITTSKAGAWDDGMYMNLVYQNAIGDPEFSMIAVPAPVKEAGEQVHFGRFNGIVRRENSIAVTTSCEYPEVAVQWIDYFYSLEGTLLANYGIEGKTYTLVEGEPQFTDLILNNSEGLSILQAQYKYLLHDGPRYNVQVENNGGVIKEEDMVTGNTWLSNADSAYMLPLINFTDEEGARTAALMGDISTYFTEMTVKFIIGAKPLSEYDEFVDELYAMNIEEVIGLYQDALDRYNSR